MEITLKVTLDDNTIDALAVKLAQALHKLQASSGAAPSIAPPAQTPAPAPAAPAFSRAPQPVKSAESKGSQALARLAKLASPAPAAAAPAPAPAPAPAAAAPAPTPTPTPAPIAQTPAEALGDPDSQAITKALAGILGGALSAEERAARRASVDKILASVGAGTALQIPKDKRAEVLEKLSALAASL